MKKSIIISILIASCVVSLFLHLYQRDALGLNEDEASHGYNTYSVLQTGRDEYGKLPLRYLAFGENKLPLAGMLGSPFIGMFGLHTWTVRMPTLIIGSLFPLLIFAAMYSLSRNLFTSSTAAFFGATNIWLQVLSRHLHEAVIFTGFVLLYITVLFWKRQLPKKHMIILSILSLLSLFSYHSAKVVMPVLALFSIVLYYRQLKGDVTHRLKGAVIFFVILSVAFVLFFATEYIVPNNRVANLSYVTNPVFVYEIEEGRKLGGSKLFYNRPIYGAYQIAKRTLNYISPDFLLFQSDENPRFGASYLPLLTWLEYILFLIGLVAVGIRIISKRISMEYAFIGILLIISILPASLSLLEGSATRSYLLCIPIVMLGSIGAGYVADICVRFFKSPLIAYLIIATLFAVQIMLVSDHWSTYFYRYLKDPQTCSTWQCGMQDVAEFAWQNYDAFEKITISSPMGQPYIFMLVYGGPYPPQKYQKIAKQLPYNSYGFWEQGSFDKFSFTHDLRCERGVKSLQISLTKDVMTQQNQTKKWTMHGSGSTRFYSFVCKN
ncbi:MAG: hypothetical protein WCJ70_01235 [bacterium]